MIFILVFVYFVLYEIYQCSEYKTQYSEYYHDHYVIHQNAIPAKPPKASASNAAVMNITEVLS